MIRRQTFCNLLGLIATLLVASLPTGAAPPTTTTTAPTGQAAAGTLRLTVAILDFQCTAPASPELGQQVAEVLTATLSGEPAYTLVDRASLERALKEQELNLSGVVSPQQATRIGKVVGAKLLVTGKVFTVDKQTFLTAKIIGTETSLVDGLIVKGDDSAGVAGLMMQLAERLNKRLPEVGPKLIAAPDAALDPLPALKQRLAGLRRPIVAVRVTERHVTPLPGPTTRADPAVETELKMMLAQCGFTVVEGADDKDLARAGAEVLITGEAFSEMAARIGNLVSCTDRVELRVVNFKTGTLLLADRDSNRGVDLSEHLAGKQALEKSGRVLGLHLLDHFAATLPPAK